MRSLSIVLNGKEYTLASSLRVAYTIQNQHNHKSYVELLSSIDKMNLEDQVGIVYAAFKVANPFDAQSITRDKFFNIFLDNFTVKDLSEYMNAVISSILGTDLTEDKDEDEDESGENSDIEGN